MATSTQINAITALYVGYFDRAPDPAGLQFWIDQLDNGREYNTIAADFAASPEAVALYPYLTTPDVSSPASFVTNIYANLFGRTPDQEGLDFWTGVLEDGSVSVADMIEAIIMGARDDEDAGTFDKSVLDNKVEVGLDFATSAAEVPGFEFDAAAKAAAVAAVNGVTEDEATVEAAKEATDAFVSGDSNPGTGDNLTLTDAIGESVVGTAGNDTFTGVIGDSGSTGTLQFGDQLNGGAGMDTLNLFAADTNNKAIPAGVSISNVEVINLNGGAGSADADTNDAELTAATTVDASQFGAAAKQIWQVGTTANVTGLAAGQTAGFRGGDAQATVRYNDDVASASIALQAVNSGAAITVAGDDLESVTVAGSVKATVENTDTDENNLPGFGDDGVPLSYEKYGVLTLNIDDADNEDGIQTVNLSLSNDTQLNVDSGFDSIETFDASGSTGGIIASLDSAGDDLALTSATTGSGNDAVRVDTTKFAEDITISTGAGNDMLAISTGGANDATVDMGAGNDTVNIAAGNSSVAEEAASLTVTLGAGKDTVAIGGSGNLADDADTDAEVEASLVTITDFMKGEDSIDLPFDFSDFDTQSGATGVDAAVDGLGLAEAVEALRDGGFQEAQFNLGGNLYIFDENGAEDILVELTGVSTLLGASDFVASA